MGMKMVKIGTVELTEEEAYKMYEEGKYIVTYSKIYQLFFSTAQKRVYGRPIYSQKGLARRGRFYSMEGKTVNHVLGFDLVVTDEPGTIGEHEKQQDGQQLPVR